MSSIKNAVIAAAGIGSRLALGKPKCLLEVDGKTMLEGLLALLKDVENVFLVVGYMEGTLIEEAFHYRKDIIIVRNADYNNNTTCDSYAMGAKAVKGNVLYMDADLIIEEKSFQCFLKQCVEKDILIGITNSKTRDAVYVKEEKGSVIDFSREEVTAYEWCNVLYAPSDFFKAGDKWVYGKLQEVLPQPACKIDCWEIDSPEDFENYNKRKLI